jgi:predicted membrane protein DUF2085
LLSMIGSATLGRAFVGATVLWALALPLASFAVVQKASTPAWYAFAFLVYAIGSLVCHQLPARSFHLWSVPLPVCARCMGVYAGAAIAAVVASLRSLQLPLAASVKAPSVRRNFDRRRRPDATGVFPGTTATFWRSALIVGAMPTAATLAYEWATAQTPANWIRASAGFPLGAVVALIVVNACASAAPPEKVSKVN